MDAISALHGRISIATLGQPGPTSEQLDTMLRAAVRAPDHGVLRPWRFIVLQGSEREALAIFLFRHACVAPPTATPKHWRKCAGRRCAHRWWWWSSPKPIPITASP